MNMERNLLFVEDDESIKKSMGRLFGRTFGKVFIAADLNEAAAICKQQEITHLVADLHLGSDEEMGLDLIFRLKEQYPSIRYTAIYTGTNINIDNQQGFINDVFQKPYDLQKIVETLAETP